MQIRIIEKKLCGSLLVILFLYLQLFHLSQFISISFLFKYLLPLSCTSAEIVNSVAKANSKTQHQEYLRRCVDFKHFFQTQKYIFSFTRMLWLTTCVALACFCGVFFFFFFSFVNSDFLLNFYVFSGSQVQCNSEPSADFYSFVI